MQKPSNFKKDNKIKKVGIGFATGRELFKDTLMCQYNNWKKSGIIDDPRYEINIFISYDINYTGVKEEQFRNIDKEIIKNVKNVYFINQDEIDEYVNQIHTSKGISKNEINTIIGTHEYSKLRNAILYKAIEQQIDYLLFLDDDEYPAAPIQRNDGMLEWVEQDVLKTHLEYIENAHITFGHHCGYVSPIPYVDFENDISEKDFKLFIEAISNDIVNWNKIRKLLIENKGITYAKKEFAYKEKSYEIDPIDGFKWVSGSNMCLNLRKLGYAYPFYNPPNARGEDSFFSTMLNDEKVIKIPVYNFHDGFLKYIDITQGKYPSKLDPIKINNFKVRERFLKACVGWIRYKPLLVYVTNKEQYIKTVDKIIIDLDKSLSSVEKYSNSNEVYEILNELYYYNSKVKEHFCEFENVKELWKTFNSFENIKLNEI